ncbi:HEPN domain-containing protein [Terrilactibacillus laevilacticus]|uniref:HEPN domain-containing protein n=1 Tax=Terrilactibacillus laevilacticus TaxID=1380157 RepID=UPI00114716E1|nr:HEPN domain-containing protein [Terrilactibacillus laevilacticus]
MNRFDFQQLAEIRLKEAEILIENKQYDGAYYLSGYVIECALKACIAKKTREYDFPPNRIKNIYTHELSKLVGEAGLRIENSLAEINWAVVKDWSEQHRYSFHSELEAKNIYSAVSDPETGVLQWIKQYW